MSTTPSGNENPIAKVYVRLRTSLMRYSSRYFKKHHEIEDVVQEAFVKVLEAQGGRNIQSMDAYLFRTARNVALNTLKKSENRLSVAVGDLLDDLEPEAGSALEDDFQSRQEFELFCESLIDLPERCQQAFVLRRVYGFSQAEIAKRMEISESTVERHLAKGIVLCERAMRKRLAGDVPRAFRRNQSKAL